MVNQNSIIILLVAVLLLNYATGDFLFSQISKVDIDPYSGSLQCVAGAYMYSPTWNGLPMPSADDLIVAAISGLVILGIFSTLNKPLSKREKFWAFAIPWIAYRVAGYFLMLGVPGCLQQYETFEQAVSPLTIIFTVFGLYFIIKFLRRK